MPALVLLAALALLWLATKGRLRPLLAKFFPAGLSSTKLLAVLAAAAGLALLLRGDFVGAMVGGAIALILYGKGLLRAKTRAGAGRRIAAMAEDEREAMRILGLSPLAGRADVLAAHRRLIRTAHPDQQGARAAAGAGPVGGGPDAGRINAARDLLLARIDRNMGQPRR